MFSPTSLQTCSGVGPASCLSASIPYETVRCDVTASFLTSRSLLPGRGRFPRRAVALGWPSGNRLPSVLHDCLLPGGYLLFLTPPVPGCRGEGTRPQMTSVCFRLRRFTVAVSCRGDSPGDEAEIPLVSSVLLCVPRGFCSQGETREGPTGRAHPASPTLVLARVLHGWPGRHPAWHPCPCLPDDLPTLPPRPRAPLLRPCAGNMASDASWEQKAKASQQGIPALHRPRPGPGVLPGRSLLLEGPRLPCPVPQCPRRLRAPTHPLSRTIRVSLSTTHRTFVISKNQDFPHLKKKPPLSAPASVTVSLYRKSELCPNPPQTSTLSSRCPLLPSVNPIFFYLHSLPRSQPCPPAPTITLVQCPIVPDSHS